MTRLIRKTLKKPAKDQREKLVLLKLVELYLETAKPIGSNTLKLQGFEALSSATIRNYFAKLEDAGYLKQQHSSGGRIPTSLAFRVFAEHHRHARTLSPKEEKLLSHSLDKETKEIASYLHEAAETLSKHSRCAVFLSSPRFDQDFLQDIKLVAIDSRRCLCILLTDFGLVHSELIHLEKKMNETSFKRVEAYLRWRLSRQNRPKLIEEEELIGAKIYSEVMLRHIVNYTHFSQEEITKTGFSRLLSYPEFNDAASLASGLSLFEDPTSLRQLLAEVRKNNQLTFWIGEDLLPYSLTSSACSVIAMPYTIHKNPVGAIGLLCPLRVNYPHLFSLIEKTAQLLSSSLTRSVYKYKMSYREPKAAPLFYLEKTQRILLEDKRSSL